MYTIRQFSTHEFDIIKNGNTLKTMLVKKSEYTGNYSLLFGDVVSGNFRKRLTFESKQAVLNLLNSNA